MTIILAGGTGFIGKSLIERLHREQYRIILLTRNPGNIRRDHPNLFTEQWDARTVGPWAKHVDGAEAIINLTGELVAGKRWTKGQKEIILGSRVDATRAIVKAIEQASKKPSVLINASGVDYYGNVTSSDVPESFPKGTGFIANVCDQWEQEALAAQKSGVRVVTPRFGIVLAGDGGALKKMMLPFKLFAGGSLGSGKQWFPWIHRDDVVEGIMFLLRSRNISGAVNFVAPEAVTMKEFSQALGKSLHRPSWAPVPSIVLRVTLGELAEMLLAGRRVLPKRLLEAGFVFKYPKLDQAFDAILKRKT